MTGGRIALGTRQTLWSVQYLRAAAAVAVVFYHQFLSIPLVARSAYHGVDLFFVISGFIMVVITADRRVTPGRFLLDRVTRVAPLYWSATLLAFALAAGGWPMWHPCPEVPLLVASLLFVPSLNPYGVVQPTLFLGWTLNVEMAFYLVYALALLAPARARLPALTAALAALVVAGALLPARPAALSAATTPLLLEFLLGAWLGRWFAQGGARAGWAAPLAPLLPYGAACFAFPELGAGLGSYLALLLMLRAEALGRLPRLPALKRVGDASFSIYLLQEFAFSAVFVAVRALEAGSGHALRHAAVGGACVVAALALGFAGHALFERPLTRRVRAALEGRTRAVARAA